MIVDCAVYRDVHRTEGPDGLSDALAAARASGGFVWIGLHEPTEKEFALVTEEFALHPLAVEDALKAVYEPAGATVTTGDASAVTVRHDRSTKRHGRVPALNTRRRQPSWRTLAGH